MPRQLLVFGDKTFKITIPDDAKVTFGPWSPGKKEEMYADRAKVGTLRVYQGSKENILACFGGVRGFRDLSMDYAEEVVREEGSVIWKSDSAGYVREEKASRASDWVEPAKQLPAGKPLRKRRIA